jgi:hypothetical protein
MIRGGRILRSALAMQRRSTEAMQPLAPSAPRLAPAPRVPFEIYAQAGKIPVGGKDRWTMLEKNAGQQNAHVARPRSILWFLGLPWQ